MVSVCAYMKGLHHRCDPDTQLLADFAWGLDGFRTGLYEGIGATRLLADDVWEPDGFRMGL